MKKPRRLIWQLYPSYLLVVLISLLATGWYASSAMHRFYISQIRENLYHEAQLLIDQFVPLLDPINTEAVDTLCKSRGRLIPQRITVILPDGVVIGDSKSDPAKMENHGDRLEIQGALRGEPASATRFSATLDQQMLYMAIPIRDQAGNRQKNQGVIRVSIATSAMDMSLRELRVRLIWGGLIIALLASVVCLVISRRISLPIETMRQGAARFAAGNLAHRLNTPSTVELAALAEAMNQMANDLENRIQAVIRQRNEFQAVLSSMMEGVIALDHEERILHCNQTALGMFSQLLEHVRGRSIQEIIRNRDLHDMLRETVAKGTKTEGDIILLRPAGRVMNVHCTPLLDADETRIGALVVMNDVTQLRRLENMRSDFAANVSHEIKTPLTAIQGFVETLHHGNVDDPEEASRFLGIIHRHVLRLVDIIDDLMKLSRLEQDDEGKQLNIEPGRVRNMIADAVQMCGKKAADKRIDLKIHCDDDLSVNMDAALMEQAVVNLLDNAIKYSPENSRIDISAERDGDNIIMHFKDQGIGIAARHLSRLFERFYRVDKARSRKLGGTGLGLAIVKHIVQAHGGQVGVESVQGTGSTFTILIPAGPSTATRNMPVIRL
jgi:two-component system phosphate regulon sensor histidine kinase PhoR